MPVILVIEQDERVPSRVRQALEPEGWRVIHARGVAGAMQAFASEGPDLLLVTTEADGARDALASYARRRGGPGTVALVPDAPPGEPGVPGGAGRASTEDTGADASLHRSFAADELRQVVREVLGGGASPARPGGDEPKLTSQEIFGDLLAEVGEGGEGSGSEAPGPADEAAAAGAGAGSETAPTPPSPAPPDAPRRREAAPRKAPPAGRDDELDRKLEQTISGVLGRPAPAKKPPAEPPGPSGDHASPERAAAPGKPAKPAQPRRRSDDLDRLLSETLSGLELPGERKKAEPRPAEGSTAGDRPPPTPDRPREEAAGAVERRRGPGGSFELADLEALIERRQRRERASGQGSPAPATGAEPSAAPEPPPQPPTPGSKPAPKPPPFQPSFAEAMEEMPDDGGAEPADAPRPPETPAAAGEGEAEDPPGGDFGQYQLLERIGVGGMAEVWKARMTGVEGFRKTVAIKRILPHLTDSSDFVDMFIDEAKLAAQLNHAHIIHIYDLGKIGRDYYIAMEHVEGENLRSILNRSREEARPVPLGLALHVGARLASALEYAHRKRDFDDREMGLVHRDVSPQNVLVGYEGTIKLCDFGIVKAVSKSSHTRMGALKGKLQYMSPEQAWGRPVDGRSDVFSLGALLFEMLTGRRLFAGESEMEVLEAVRECRIAPPSELEPAVPEDVDAVVLDALRADPEERLQSAGELERRLDEVLATMRPTPGQSELSDYMRRLFRSEGGPVGPAAEPAAAAPPGSADAAPRPEGIARGPEPEPATPSAPPAAPPAPLEPVEGAGASPEGAGREEAPAAPEAEPPASPEAQPAAKPAGLGEASPGEEGVEAVEPMASVSPAEVEEGGGRGKGLLVAAIVAAVIAGTLLAWLAGRRGALPWQEPTAPEAPVEAPGQSAPDPGGGDGSSSSAAAGPATPQDGSGEAGEGVADADERSGTDGDAGPPPDDPAAEAGAEQGSADPHEGLDETVDEALQERLARQEEELRRQFEAKERELQERLEALREEESAEDAPPPPEPEPPAPPPHPAPEPQPEPEPNTPEPNTPEPGTDRPAPPEESRTTTAPASEGPGAERSAGSPAGEPAAAGPASAGRDEQAPEPPPNPAPEPAPEAREEPAVREGELVTTGPGVEPPKLVRFDKPEYPPVARRLGVQGVVVVSVLVAETGEVTEVRLVQRVRQDVGLNEAALDAARTARYRPATKHGVRVKMWTTLRIPFQL